MGKKGKSEIAGDVRGKEKVERRETEGELRVRVERQETDVEGGGIRVAFG